MVYKKSHRDQKELSPAQMQIEKEPSPPQIKRK